MYHNLPVIMLLSGHTSGQEDEALCHVMPTDLYQTKENIQILIALMTKHVRKK